jgi:hypothetical protein
VPPLTAQSVIPSRGHVQMTLHAAKNIPAEKFTGSSLVKLTIKCGHAEQISSELAQWRQSEVNFGDQVLEIPLSLFEDSPHDGALYVVLEFITAFGPSLVGVVERLPLYAIINKAFPLQWLTLRQPYEDSLTYSGELCVSMEYVGPVAISVLGACRLYRPLAEPLPGALEPLPRPCVFLEWGSQTFKTPTAADPCTPLFPRHNTMFVSAPKLTHELCRAVRRAERKETPQSRHMRASDPAADPFDPANSKLLAWSGLHIEVPLGNRAINLFTRVQVLADTVFSETLVARAQLPPLTVLKAAETFAARAQPVFHAFCHGIELFLSFSIRRCGCLCFVSRASAAVANARATSAFPSNAGPHPYTRSRSIPTPALTTTRALSIWGRKRCQMKWGLRTASPTPPRAAARRVRTWLRARTRAPLRRPIDLHATIPTPCARWRGG